MLKILMIILAILGVVVISGFAWAKHNGYCSGGDFMQRASERVSHKLELDDNQEAKLKGFTEKLRALRDSSSAGRTPIRDEIGGLLTAPSLDRDRVTALLDERHQTMTERKAELVNAFGDFSDSLKPEQRTRLAELIAERLNHRWGGPPHWVR